MSPEGFWEHEFLLHPWKINLRKEGQWPGEGLWEKLFEETIWENPGTVASPAPKAQNIPISQDFELP